MKVNIEYDTNRSQEVKVTIDEKSMLLARDAQMIWRTEGCWIANASATPMDAAKCLIHSILPPSER